MKKKIREMKKETKEKNPELELMIKSVKLNNPDIEEEILEAFRICDRKFFVAHDPYRDEPQHVAHGQTISQPSTIARMIRLLRVEPGLDVLEVGANTGYHAALVAYLVWPGKTAAIEIFPDLAEMARKNVKALLKHLEKNKRKEERKRFEKIEIFTGDALDKKQKIWQSKYDRIYFTAGVELDKLDDVKKMGKTLLNEDGLLLFPTREAYDWGALEVWQKKKGKLKPILRETGYAFVPLLKKEELEEFYKKR